MRPVVLWQDRFYRDLMPPAIAKIVLVDKALANWGRDPLETGTAIILDLEFPFVAWLGVDGLANEELVQMIILPAHDHLQTLMQAIQAESSGHTHLPPDGRLDALQGDVELIGHRSRRGHDLGSLAASRALAHGSAPPLRRLARVVRRSSTILGNSPCAAAIIWSL